MFLGILFKLRSELCCAAVKTFLTFFSNSEQRGRWRGRGKVVQELGVPRENRTLFTSRNWFQMCSWNAHYTSFISSAEQRPQEVLEHEVGEGQKTRLFPTQESTAGTVGILQPKNILKENVNQALTDSSSARERRARDRFFL